MWFTEKEGISFLSERDRIPLILHSANETYKELTKWYTLNGEKHDFENVKRQAMLTGLYTAWAHDLTSSKDPTEDLDKAQMIGARAGRLHSDNLEQKSPHDILFSAEKSVADFKKQLNKQKEKITLKSALLPSSKKKFGGHRINVNLSSEKPCR